MEGVVVCLLGIVSPIGVLAPHQMTAVQCIVGVKRFADLCVEIDAPVQ